MQCLAMADERQCEPLVRGCIERLVRGEGGMSIVRRGAATAEGASETFTDAPADNAGGGGPDLRDAMRCPQLRDLLDGLRHETKAEIIRGMAGLPFGFKVGEPGLVVLVEDVEMICHLGPRVETVERFQHAEHALLGERH